MKIQISFYILYSSITNLLREHISIFRIRAVRRCPVCTGPSSSKFQQLLSIIHNLLPVTLIFLNAFFLGMLIRLIMAIPGYTCTVIHVFVCFLSKGKRFVELTCEDSVTLLRVR